ncbi:uncharacterized protein BDR25DRAFT_187625, partial [Lindgomyces ingoldianus]
KTVWPKNKDMKPLPTDEESDGGVSFRSNSNGDPNYDIKKLIDWEGNWLPAPVEWDGRKVFHNRHLGDHIEAWINRSDDRTCYMAMDITPEFTAEKNGELVPRSWVPVKIEDDAPQHFWRALPTRAPPPLSDIELAENPWWESYQEGTASLLNPLTVPEAKVDPTVDDNQLPGMMVSSEEAVKRRNFAQAERVRKLLAKRNRSYKEVSSAIQSALTNLPDRALKPTANIYIRPVFPADIRQITDIYNYYVKQTIRANEFNERQQSQMAHRIEDITTRNLPWIVAVNRGDNPKGRSSQYVNEKIVGFANIDDYCDQGSMYRFTFELELYVHSAYQSQGIGKCLLDRMISIADTSYNPKGGYEWIARGDYLRNGCGRVVKTIIATVPHEPDTGEINRVSSLLKLYNFRKCGHLYQMGFKYGKKVDVSIFQYITTETIEANLKPTTPL